MEAVPLGLSLKRRSRSETGKLRGREETPGRENTLCYQD